MHEMALLKALTLLAVNVFLDVNDDRALNWIHVLALQCTLGTLSLSSCK